MGVGGKVRRIERDIIFVIKNINNYEVIQPPSSSLRFIFEEVRVLVKI